MERIWLLIFALAVLVHLGGCEKPKPAAPTPPPVPPTAKPPQQVSIPPAATTTAPAGLAPLAFAPQPPVAPTRPSAEVTLSAVTIAQEWKADASAAVAKYGGKVIDVSGTIDSFGRTLDYKPFIRVRGSDNKTFILCLTQHPRPWSAAGLAQSVTIRGVGLIEARDSSGMRQAALTDCEIAALGPSRVYSMDTTELAERCQTPRGVVSPFLTGPDNLRRSLLLTGTVQSGGGHRSVKTVRLATQRELIFECVFFDATDVTAAASLRPGQAVTVYVPSPPVSISPVTRLEKCLLVAP